ncbi:NUMOD4 domain-containing protein [Hoylesella timonensis]|uniref:NUMOD4 domain-containing protein n=1 Tax=Hoylesella timonensis TaxID=386414 RepID=UPI001898F399|nr:NUMOD4 domain-containing protein [Hoylesella timonensis]
MEEIWKDIKGYKGDYQISSWGRVRSFKGKYVRYLKPQIKKNGYYYITFGDKRRFTIHRLVATYFIENPNCYPIINHKDSNKLNNRFTNLEWCTYSYNNKYAYSHNEKKPYSPPKGINNCKAKIVSVYNQYGIKIDGGISIGECSKKYSINTRSISKCINGRSISTNGYIILLEQDNSIKKRLNAFRNNPRMLHIGCFNNGNLIFDCFGISEASRISHISRDCIRKSLKYGVRDKNDNIWKYLG